MNQDVFGIDNLMKMFDSLTCKQIEFLLKENILLNKAAFLCHHILFLCHKVYLTPTNKRNSLVTFNQFLYVRWIELELHFFKTPFSFTLALTLVKNNNFYK